MFLRPRWLAALAWMAVAGVVACHGKQPVRPKLEETAAARELVQHLRERLQLQPSPSSGGTPVRLQREGNGFVPELGQEPVGTTRPARLRLPWLARDPVHLVDAETGVAADFALEDVRKETAATASGALVYPAAKLIRQPRPDGVQDSLWLDEPPSGTEVTYALSLSTEIVGLRLVGNVLELLDAAGAPRLRLDPPKLVTAAREEHEATLSVTDCDVDESPITPWGRPVTVPGSRQCQVHLRWGKLPAGAYPALLQARWTTTGSMVHPRAEHAAVSLGRGLVFVTGGIGAGQRALSSAEVYDANSGTWSSTGALVEARAGHTLTSLGRGQVLAVGGRANEAPSSALSSAELYDQASGTWKRTAESMSIARSGHTAMLSDEGHVLVIGGEGVNGQATASVERYVPGLDRWIPFPEMNVPRQHHATVRLSGGVIMAIGGESGGNVLGACELYDPVTQRWNLTTSLSVPRSQFGAVTVGGAGTVVVAGGKTAQGATDSVEWYRVSTGTWSTGPSLHSRRVAPAMGLLGSGAFVITGGEDAGSVLGMTELGSALEQTWTAVGTLQVPRVHASMTVIGGGTVLMVGGVAPEGPTSISERISVPQKCSAAADCPNGLCVDGYCCDSACNAGPCDRCDLAGQQGICSLVPAGENGDPSCEPYACNGTSAACMTTCTTDLECTDHNYCERGACVSKLFNGLSCTRSEQCESGHCSASHNGVCTERQAAAVKVATAVLPASTGTKKRAAHGVSVVAASTAPKPQLEVVVPAAAPAKHADGEACASAEECGSGYCVDGLCCNTPCTEDCGSCRVPGHEGSCAIANAGTASSECAPLLCDGLGFGCPQLCQTGADCDAEHLCIGGQCRAMKPLGAPCVDARDCESDFCVDGVCCNNACEGSCATCAQPGKEGTCSFVVGASASGRPPCATEGICGGSCDGTSGKCAYAKATTVCAPAFCSAGIAMEQSTCDGNGRCSPGAQTTCSAGCGPDDRCAPASVTTGQGCSSMGGAGMLGMLLALLVSWRRKRSLCRV